MSFKFDTATSDDGDKALFEEIIKPGIIPANFFGKNQSATYEFYNSSVASRQLGFGQLTIGLYFVDVIKPREIIPKAIYYDWMKNLTPNSATVDLDSWRLMPFTSPLFMIHGVNTFSVCHLKFIALNMTRLRCSSG